MATSTPPSDRQLLSYAEVEAIYGIKTGTLAAYVHRRQIPHIRIGRRLVRFDRAELDAWIDARRVAAETIPSRRAAGAPKHR